MKAGTIEFAGTDLALYGTPRFTQRRSPSPAAPALPTHWQIEFTVSVDLRADMPATVWARARALQNLLATHPKALLVVRDENGTAFSWMATPGENSLPQAIERGSGRVEMNFSTVQAVAEADFPLGITVDPLDGGDLISIARPMSWVDTHSLSRVDGRAAIRSEIASRITFTARTAFADSLADAGTRAEALITECARLNALASKEARLRFAGYDEVVQFENFTASPSEGWEYVELSAQARRVTLPGEDEAEVTFKASFTTDPATGETRINVSGNIEAADSVIAHAKADAILAAYRTGARRVVRVKKEDSWADGEDAEMPVWLGIDFDYELTESTTATRYTVKIDTREGADGTRTTYSGSASAATLTVLLATIQTAAGNKHPVELRSELSVEWSTDDQGTLKLVSGTFSHEYQTASDTTRGEIRQTASKANFGDWTVSLSGKLAAVNLTTARTVARSFIPAGVILREDSEVEGKPFVASAGNAVTTQFATLDFSYAWGTAHTQTAMTYTDRESPRYETMTAERALSGTVWAATKAAAKAQIDALASGLSLTRPTKEELVASHERVNASSLIDRALSWSFSRTYESKLTGTIGHDIIEANWSIERTGQVDHEPMTEIPLGFPVKQIPFGHNIGRLVASGSCRARVQSTARAWGQAKRADVASQGGIAGAADPPVERMQQTMVPFNGTDAAFHEFSFTYPFRYATGLTGVWPSSGLTL